MKRTGGTGKNDGGRFFGEFPKSSADRWKSSILRELKGAGYEKLVWNPCPGMAVEPFYCPEDTDGLNLFPAPAPGNFPFTRESSHWEICEDIPSASVSRAAELARAGSEGGAERVLFRGIKPRTAKDIEKLFSGIDLSKTGVCFADKSGGIAVASALADFAEKTGCGNLRGFVLCNPLGLPAKGETGKSETKRLAKLLPRFARVLPDFRCVGVSGSHFHNAGANIVEETALSLALGAEYLTVLRENGVPAQMASEATVFHFSVGSLFFMEIAKLRAARAVWAHIVEKFDGGLNGRMNIHASVSAVNKSVCAPETNILRATGEAMSAALGGCDSLSIPAFDGGYETDPAKSQSVSRNTQLILREECKLDGVADPCAGSYYADILTEKLAHSALRLFQEIEERGGFLKCSENGFVEKLLERSRKTRAERIATGRESLIGVNRYPIHKELISGRVGKGPGTANAGADFERLRTVTEKHARGTDGKFPSVFLVKTGDPAIRSARSVFAANFFAAAGFEIKDSDAFDCADEAAKAAVKSGANVFVICSEDGGYGEFVPLFMSRILKKTKNAFVAVAGNPDGENRRKCAEAGIDEFIHARSNMPETLKKIQKASGVGKKK